LFDYKYTHHIRQKIKLSITANFTLQISNMEIKIHDSDKKFIIDKKDGYEVDCHIWQISSKGIPYTRIDKKAVFIHEFLVGKKEGKIIIHLNKNKLDNRRRNLKHMTRKESLPYVKRDNTNLQYKGTVYDEEEDRYYGIVESNGFISKSPPYKREYEAAEWYNWYATLVYDDKKIPESERVLNRL